MVSNTGVNKGQCSRRRAFYDCLSDVVLAIEVDFTYIR
jgi:hypothetical protein